MSFALSYSGIVYNTPALLLGWLLYKRPFLGLVLAWMAYERVFTGSVLVSVHAMVSGGALVALPGWQRLTGIALAVFTGYYQLHLWGNAEAFLYGLEAGMLFGFISWLGWKLYAFMLSEERAT